MQTGKEGRIRRDQSAARAGGGLLDVHYVSSLATFPNGLLDRGGHPVDLKW